MTAQTSGNRVENSPKYCGKKNHLLMFVLFHLGVLDLLDIANIFGGCTNTLVGRTGASSQVVLYGRYEMNTQTWMEDICAICRGHFELNCLLCVIYISGKTSTLDYSILF